MRAPFTLCLLAASLGSAGCVLVRDGTGLVGYKLRERCSDCGERWRDQRWAAQAWKQVKQSNPQHVFSDDYAKGFKEGFVDLLFRGGTGEPPLVAPRRYRGVGYQTPNGYRAVQDWFDGYRHGSAQACKSAYRQLVTGPCSLLQPGLDHLTPTEPQNKTTLPLGEPRFPPPPKAGPASSRQDAVLRQYGARLATPVQEPSLTVPALEPDLDKKRPQLGFIPIPDNEEDVVRPVPDLDKPD